LKTGLKDVTSVLCSVTMYQIVAAAFAAQHLMLHHIINLLVSQLRFCSKSAFLLI